MPILDCSPLVPGLPIAIFKRCYKCGEYKLREEFSQNKSEKDGLQKKCKLCDKQYYAEHRGRHSPSRTLYNQQYREKNKERLNEKDQKYRTENRKRNAEYQRAYYAANREKVLERVSQHAKQNPDQVIAKSHRRRALKIGNGGTYTTADLATVRAAQTDKRGRLICWHCGKPIKGTPHLDHWIPLAEGGTNDAGNLHYMHARCNLTKSAKHPTELGRLL